jgi:hypothetical protein
MFSKRELSYLVGKADGKSGCMKNKNQENGQEILMDSARGYLIPLPGVPCHAGKLMGKSRLPAGTVD